MLRMIEIFTWALGGIIVGAFAGFGAALLFARCPRTPLAGERPVTDDAKVRPFRRDRQYGHTGTEG